MDIIGEILKQEMSSESNNVIVEPLVEPVVIEEPVVEKVVEEVVVEEPVVESVEKVEEPLVERDVVVEEQVVEQVEKNEGQVVVEPVVENDEVVIELQNIKEPEPPMEVKKNTSPPHQPHQAPQPQPRQSYLNRFLKPVGHHLKRFNFF